MFRKKQKIIKFSTTSVDLLQNKKIKNMQIKLFTVKIRKH